MVSIENIAKIVGEKFRIKNRRFDSREEAIHNATLVFFDAGTHGAVLNLPPPSDSEANKKVDIKDTQILISASNIFNQINSHRSV